MTRTLDDEADYLQHYLEAKLPKGIIHGDLYPDNLLFKGQKIVGVLDFEVAGRGKFIYDMATAVNALCFDGDSYHLPLFEAFVSGYESLRTLALAEWDAFPNELRFSAFRLTVTRLKEVFADHGDDRGGRQQGFSGALRLSPDPSSRAGWGHGRPLDGNGDWLRLPEVPEGEGHGEEGCAVTLAARLGEPPLRPGACSSILDILSSEPEPDNPSVAMCGWI